MIRGEEQDEDETGKRREEGVENVRKLDHKM